MGRLLVPLALGLTAVSFAALGLTVALSGRSQERTNHAICLSINNLNVLISKTLQRSKHNLPKLTYYREHRAELRDQLSEIDRTLRVFRPRNCP